MESLPAPQGCGWVNYSRSETGTAFQGKKQHVVTCSPAVEKLTLMALNEQLMQQDSLLLGPTCSSCAFLCVLGLYKLDIYRDSPALHPQLPNMYTLHSTENKYNNIHNIQILSQIYTKDINLKNKSANKRKYIKQTFNLHEKKL